MIRPFIRSQLRLITLPFRLIATTTRTIRQSKPFRPTCVAIQLLACTHLFLTKIATVSPSAGVSMMPTFAYEGTWTLTDCTHARNRRGELQVGDLVVYAIPISPYAIGIKRLVGLPGDYVMRGIPETKGEESTIQVPEGHCWVVGDNMAASRDSKVFGPLPLALIKGKVVAQVLPWARRHWIENPMQPVSAGY